MDHAKSKAERETKLDAECQALHPRWVKLGQEMQAQGYDPVSITESALTTACANMLAVQGPERTVHALMAAAGGIAEASGPQVRQ